MSGQKKARAGKATGGNDSDCNSVESPADTVKPRAGWFKASRGNEPLELLKANPAAFILAYVIAYRAQWQLEFNRYGLQLGEAVLGDFQNYGMTEQNYRTAKAQLEKWKFATFRVTNRGTIGKLIDTRLFSSFSASGNGQTNRQLTDSQRTANGQVTTSKSLKSEKKKKKLKKSAYPPPLSSREEEAGAGQEPGRRYIR